MKTTHAVTTNIVFVVLVLLIAASMGYGQTSGIVLTNNTTVTGTGLIKVKGSIYDSALTKIDTIHGAVYLTGTVASGAQTLGAGSTGSHPGLMFDTLRVDSGGTKTMGANVQVGGSFYFMNTAGTFNQNSHALRLDGATAKYGGTLTANNAADSTLYDAASGTQDVIDGNYTKLALSGAAKKDFLGAVAVSNTFNHTGGNLAVNQNLTLSAGYTFATIDSVYNTKTLTLGTTGTIGAITDITGGTLVNGTGALTVTTLTNSHGTITAAANHGGMTFTTSTANNGTIICDNGAVTFGSAMTNNGPITGGAGLVTFSGTLANTSGTITPGAGRMNFAQAVTLNGGTITCPAQADSIYFANNLAVNSGATFSLTGAGAARIDGALSLAAGGTLSFAGTSSMTYNGAAQTIAPANYGNLIMNGTGTAAGNTQDTVAGNLTVNQTLAMAAGDSLMLTNANGTVSGTGEVTGKVTRNHPFTALKYYAFNRDSVGLSIQGAGARVMTMNMAPSTDPAGVATLNKNYVKRAFGFYDSNLGADVIRQMQLKYAAAEIQNGADPTRMSIESDASGVWSKVTGASLARVATNDAVALSGISSSTAGVSEFAVSYAPFVTVSNGDWATGGTWDMGSSPTATDDAEIRHLVTVNNNGMTAQSVLVDPAKSVTINNFGTLTVSGIFNLNSGAGAAGLTLAGSNAFLTIQNGGYMILNGQVVNNGTININQ